MTPEQKAQEYAQRVFELLGEPWAANEEKEVDGEAYAKTLTTSFLAGYAAKEEECLSEFEMNKLYTDFLFSNKSSYIKFLLHKGYAIVKKDDELKTT